MSNVIEIPSAETPPHQQLQDVSPTTLLLQESPILGYGTLLAIACSLYYGYYNIAIALCIVLVFLIAFYRYYPDPNAGHYADNQIICPCDGRITQMKKIDSHLYISIFLSPFNIHTQIYPANGTVIKRYYDHTGRFDIVTDADKCRDNEKYIHFIKLKNNSLLKITQIAGFLPRRISASAKVPEDVQAGEYLGMIKFGSRVDLLFPMQSPHGQKFKLAKNITVGARIYPSDLIGQFVNVG